MTYEEYKAIGGQETEEVFKSNIVAAESMLKKVEHMYVCNYYDPEKGPQYALRDMVDSMMLVNHSGDSDILSEKAGSYSVQRHVMSRQERQAVPFDIVCRFADVSRRAVGVVL